MSVKIFDLFKFDETSTSAHKEAHSEIFQVNVNPFGSEDLLYFDFLCEPFSRSREHRKINWKPFHSFAVCKYHSQHYSDDPQVIRNRR